MENNIIGFVLGGDDLRSIPHYNYMKNIPICSLKSILREWIEENNIDAFIRYNGYIDGKPSYRLWFNNHEEAMAFKLTFDRKHHVVQKIR